MYVDPLWRISISVTPVLIATVDTCCWCSSARQTPVELPFSQALRVHRPPHVAVIPFTDREKVIGLFFRFARTALLFLWSKLIYLLKEQNTIMRVLFHLNAKHIRANTKVMGGAWVIRLKRLLPQNARQNWFLVTLALIGLAAIALPFERCWQLN